jgi:hypothetical protein
VIVLNGVVGGMGLRPDDPKSGNFSNNLPLPGALVQVYATDAESGLRSSAMPAHSKTVGADGVWGPFAGKAGVAYEFVVTAPGYATTHIYRSALPRGSNYLHLRAERLADSDKDAAAVVIFSRPRGYFDAQRDKMSFDGQSPPPGVPAVGAGVALSKLKLADAQDRPLVAQFNGERIAGRVWPAGLGHLSILELSY